MLQVISENRHPNFANKAKTPKLIPIVQLPPSVCNEKSTTIVNTFLTNIYFCIMLLAIMLTAIVRQKLSVPLKVGVDPDLNFFRSVLVATRQGTFQMARLLVESMMALPRFPVCLLLSQPMLCSAWSACPLSTVSHKQWLKCQFWQIAPLLMPSFKDFHGLNKEQKSKLWMWKLKV